jgi:hypothetical protein
MQRALTPGNRLACDAVIRSHMQAGTGAVVLLILQIDHPDVHSTLMRSS